MGYLVKELGVCGAEIKHGNTKRAFKLVMELSYLVVEYTCLGMVN